MHQSEEQIGGAQGAAFTVSSRFPLLLWAVTRASLLLFGWMSLWLAPGGPRDAFPHEAAALRPYPALEALCRWDCGWYLRIAEHGYSSSVDANIWPLYPLAARALAVLTRMPVPFALLAVSNAACLGAYVLVYRVFARAEGEQAARWGLALFAAFPFAYFQGCAYPESMMVLFSAWAIWLADRGRPLWAGAMLGVGALARHMVILAGAATLGAQLRQHGFSFVKRRGVFGLVLPFLLVALYPLTLWLSIGQPLAFATARVNGWGEVAWWSVLHPLLAHNPDGRYTVYAIFSLVPGVGVAFLFARRRWELGAFAALLMIVCWAIGAEALGRYAAGCWPAFLPLGVFLARRPLWQAPAVAFFALFQGLFFFLFIHGYSIV